ncbi:hypothetical protein TNCV_4873921 [Trichonephila clavipes]|nr:hypothetical protein TNCV_4873921 [Trichonephila clavipes]
MSSHTITPVVAASSVHRKQDEMLTTGPPYTYTSCFHCSNCISICRHRRRDSIRLQSNIVKRDATPNACDGEWVSMAVCLVGAVIATVFQPVALR